MTIEPYKSASRVFWVVDNGSSHAGKTSIARMQNTWNNARLIHLPIHASWLNQAELYFSILQRKALTPNDFVSLEALAERLLAFGEHYRQIARPFEWTFTRTTLTASWPGSLTTSHTSSSRPNDQNLRTRLLAVAGWPGPPSADVTGRSTPACSDDRFPGAALSGAVWRMRCRGCRRGRRTTRRVGV